MQIKFSPPDIGEQEINEVVDTLRSGWITTGPKTKAFERQLAAYCGTQRAVCLNSATAAAEMTFRVLGIGEGDEVITSAYTYTASASSICHAGAKPVLVDTAPGKYEMDYDKLEAAITEKTKAIVPVDLAGIVCDYDRLYEIVARKKHLFRPLGAVQQALGRICIVTDAAHALGATRQGKVCGSIADFTTFSFHAVKNLTTGEGGAVTWREIPGVDSEELYRQYMLLSLHGQSKDALSKTQLGAWEYDIVAPYYKCNMTDIAASMGLAQLRRYPEILARRRALIGLYDRALAGAPVEVLEHYGAAHASSGHLYFVRLTGRDEAFRNELIRRMAAREIATNVHYKPLPMLKAYRDMGYDIAAYPNAYAMYCNEVTLPLHTLLTDEEAAYVAQSFLEVLEEMSAEDCGN